MNNSLSPLALSIGGSSIAALTAGVTYKLHSMNRITTASSRALYALSALFALLSIGVALWSRYNDPDLNSPTSNQNDLDLSSSTVNEHQDFSKKASEATTTINCIQD